MFIGEHHHSVDEKGRLQVPVKWRPRLSEGAVVTKGFDGSLKLYPADVWGSIASRLASLPQSDPAVRGYVRQVLAGAVDIELDKNGRFVVPPLLREFAHVKRDVVVAGLHDHIELWSAATWEGYVAGIDSANPALTEALRGVGM